MFGTGLHRVVRFGNGWRATLCAYCKDFPGSRNEECLIRTAELELGPWVELEAHSGTRGTLPNVMLRAESHWSSAGTTHGAFHWPPKLRLGISRHRATRGSPQVCMCSSSYGVPCAHGMGYTCRASGNIGQKIWG